MFELINIRIWKPFYLWKSFFGKMQYIFIFKRLYSLENLKGVEAELLPVSGGAGSKFSKKE